MQQVFSFLFCVACNMELQVCAVVRADMATALMELLHSNKHEGKKVIANVIWSSLPWINEHRTHLKKPMEIPETIRQ